jgi:hypothetical protein
LEHRGIGGVIAANRDPSAMKIVIFTLCFGSILLLAHVDPPEQGRLGRRLFASRPWASRRKRQASQ